MPSPTVSSILGAALGGLFYGTRLFVGFINSDSQDKSNKGSFLAENKINKHLKVAFEKIEKWKRYNNINCQIILAYGNNNSQKIKLNLSDIVAREHDAIFQKTLGETLSQFERLGYDLELEKIGLIDRVGNDTDYNYSQKLKDACKGKSSIILTFQEVSWDAKNKGKQKHTFWLPKDEQEIRTKVFDYLERDLETPFRKIKKWKDENKITCEINLVVDSKETIVVSRIAVDPRKYIGSPVFARDLDDKVPGRKLSKFEKFANDLTSANIEVKDEVGDSAFFEYSKKIKDACQGNKSITLNFREFTWDAGLNEKKEKHSFWVAGDSSDSREQIFNYLDRDIETPIKTINEWKQKHNINCPINIRMQGNDYLSLDKISQNPNNYIGHSHFNKTETAEDGRRISLFQKLVEGLDKKVEITDRHGHKEIYDYVGKLRQVCEDKGEIKLVHYTKKWSYKSNAPLGEQKLAYWFPSDEPNEEKLILEFLDWDRKPLLKRIEKWEKENNCEITLILKDADNEKGKGTVKEIIERPYKFFLGHAIFDKRIFIGENDEFSDSQEAGKRGISQAEKLVKDLEGPIEIRDWDMEVKNYFLFKEIKDLCRENNGKVELSWRMLKWNKKDNKTYLHYFWHRKDFNQHGAKMIGSSEIHEKLKIIKTDIPTMGTKNPFPEYLEGYFSSFGITSKDSSNKHYYSPFDF